jgi:hypothetical protein
VSKPRTVAKDRVRYKRFFRRIIEALNRRIADAAHAGIEADPEFHGVEVSCGTGHPLLSEAAFEQVAQLITPQPPVWLKEHLRRWLPMHAYAVDVWQPSRAEMRANLNKVGEAASVLIKALRSSAIVEFLDLGAEEPLRAPGNLQAPLVDIRDRGAAASRSPALVDSKGRTKAGRGRALPKAGISAKTYCALLIAETWLYFNDNYPLPRNKQAEKAADIYWRLAGGERHWGVDKLIAWRRHFREACADESEEIKSRRAGYQCHLRESEHQAQALENLSKGGT